LANVRAPLSRVTTKWFRKDCLQPFVKTSIVSAFIVYEQPMVGLRTFLLLIIVIRHYPIPRVPHDRKLIVTCENVWIQLLRVTGNVLVILPGRPEESLHAFATRFRDMDKDATILVVDHRLMFFAVNYLTVHCNRRSLGIAQFHASIRVIANRRGRDPHRTFERPLHRLKKNDCAGLPRPAPAMGGKRQSEIR
jgi:hypothetical protein